MERKSLVEYGAPRQILEELVKETGISYSELVETINRSGERVKDHLGFSENPISVNNNSVKATKFAGILKIGNSIEIEIAPKFLGLDSENDRWREDFFYLATLSNAGKLLNAEKLHSHPGERGDLYTLIARTFIEMYWENHRRSLRTYNKVNFIDFSIDGEVDPESLLYPTSDGFIQTRLSFDRKNQYNAVIVAAAKQLLPNIKEANLSSQLLRIIQILSPQDTQRIVNVSKKRLPSRLARWQSLYDLSIDILKSFGLVYQEGNSIAPGYIMDTWKVWEDFLSIALTRGFGINNIKIQHSFTLGTRERFNGGNKRPEVNVKPDLVCVLSDDVSVKSFIIDAKYKGHIEKGIKRIAESDLYEALAFSRATHCNIILLAYPAQPSENLALGDINLFEKIIVDETIVLGIEVESKGISSANGMIHFSDNLTEKIINVVKELS
ncbi:5-methylcytosine restriction system specificity protein McrC [Planococcus halotolerans]|uniref:5-methylcytosine restriction system specificity protein McrC n=1 Tax=Planococcus halotolerans TaxID=2233542 RepID=UPI001091D47A|nr:restriction endonuclease [Planococcus halotolerans]QHJ69218.1 restriction endonuclease [Planococcus halotolerans]